MSKPWKWRNNMPDIKDDPSINKWALISFLDLQERERDVTQAHNMHNSGKYPGTQWVNTRERVEEKKRKDLTILE